MKERDVTMRYRGTCTGMSGTVCPVQYVHTPADELNTPPITSRRKDSPVHACTLRVPSTNTIVSSRYIHDGPDRDRE
jgi:hypothetical protein